MNIKLRDEHLDIVLGIKKKEEQGMVIVCDDKQLIAPSGYGQEKLQLTENDSYESELLKGRLRMEVITTSLESVLESHADVAKEFSKARDVEAVAAMAKSITELYRETRQTNEILFEKKKEPDAKQGNNINNSNVIVTTSMRDLLEQLQDNGDKK